MASPFTPPTRQAGYPLALPGATALTRFVGGTASGAPVSGTFAVGDLVIDQTGKVYVCTVAGTPGTWVNASSSAPITTLYDNTLAAPAASIDTGANGIAAGYKALHVYAVLRTSEAVVTSSVNITFNNDGGANYDQSRILNANATVSGASTTGGTSVGLAVFGASASASAPTELFLVIPGYTDTTLHKTGHVVTSSADAAAADMREEVRGFRYRSTTAISRMAFAAGGGSLIAGSRVTIVGLG